MSLGDYLLPWKAVPNMVKDVRATFDGGKKGRHDSFVGAIGKYADPGGALLGDKWMNFAHGTVPREVNRALEPVGQAHRNVDPIYQFGGKNSELGRSITGLGMNKGGDISALITAGVLGAGALGGGGAGASSSSGGGWQQWASMPQQQQQQPAQQPQPVEQDRKLAALLRALRAPRDGWQRSV